MSMNRMNAYQSHPKGYSYGYTLGARPLLSMAEQRFSARLPLSDTFELFFRSPRHKILQFIIPSEQTPADGSRYLRTISFIVFT